MTDQTVGFCHVIGEMSSPASAQSIPLLERAVEMEKPSHFLDDLKVQNLTPFLELIARDMQLIHKGPGISATPTIC